MTCANLQKLLHSSAVALSVSLALPGAAQAQQPNQSLIQQQIQPMNQPQNLLLGQHQNTIQNQLPDGRTNTLSPLPLHGLNQSGSATVSESAAPPTQQGAATGAASPVESFFQVAPPARSTNSEAAKQHSKTYKFLWHFLDNIGMPMFGNHDPDLAPSLSSPFVMPPAASKTIPVVGTPVRSKPTIIDAQAAAQDPSQMAPDDSTKASSTSGPTSNPQ